MTTKLALVALLACSPVIAQAGEESLAPAVKKHQESSTKLADGQDELSADVQQLTIEQTVPKVIELLSGVEKIMDEATDNLTAYNTGSDTLAAQTEIIEKIYEAAKEKGKKPGDKGGQGMTGDSNAANTVDGGLTGGKSEVRKVPKAAGSAGRALPEEFNKALDAYNRGVQQKVK